MSNLKVDLSTEAVIFRSRTSPITNPIVLIITIRIASLINLQEVIAGTLPEMRSADSVADSLTLEEVLPVLKVNAIFSLPGTIGDSFAQEQSWFFCFKERRKEIQVIRYCVPRNIGIFPKRTIAAYCCTCPSQCGALMWIGASSQHVILEARRFQL